MAAYLDCHGELRRRGGAGRPVVARRPRGDGFCGRGRRPGGVANAVGRWGKLVVGWGGNPVVSRCSTTGYRPAPLAGVRFHLVWFPAVSLVPSSTAGYRLSSLRDEVGDEAGEADGGHGGVLGGGEGGVAWGGADFEEGFGGGGVLVMEVELFEPCAGEDGGVLRGWGRARMRRKASSI
jgi:hypothetical protein